MAEEIRDLNISIPKNYRVPGKWKRYYIRNLMEAVIASGIAVRCVLATPLIWQIKVILGCLLAALCMVTFIHGIHGKSTLQFLTTYLTFVYTKKKYHFKKLEEVYGEDHTDREKDTEDGVRNIDRIIGKLRKKREEGSEK